MFELNFSLCSHLGEISAPISAAFLSNGGDMIGHLDISASAGRIRDNCVPPISLSLETAILLEEKVTS
jgi:hypothetical protein